MAVAALIENAVTGVRTGGGPALIRLVVPRLSGHSGQDTQTYKSAAEIAAERQRDPLEKLRAQLVPEQVSAADWDLEISQARQSVLEALANVERQSAPDPARVRRYLFSEIAADGSIELQRQGGTRCDGVVLPPAHCATESARSTQQFGYRRAPHAGA